MSSDFVEPDIQRKRKSYIVIYLINKNKQHRIIN